MQAQTAPSIADTILAQLGHAPRLRMMVGARDFVDCGNALTFRFTARALSGIARVRVTLAGDDTYAVAFYDGDEAVTETTGVYADGLRETVEHFTGLALSL